MKVPERKAPINPALRGAMPGDTQVAMAAAIMYHQGKFNPMLEEPISAHIKRDVELRREVNERSIGPVDEDLTRENDRIPGNKGLLGQWDRRT